MKDGLKLEFALEAAIYWLNQLNFMVKLSPARSVWLFRASLVGAAKLAGTDGYYPDISHLWGRISGAPTESIEGSLAAGVAMPHFAEFLRQAGVDPLFAKLAGLVPCRLRAFLEVQSDLDAGGTFCAESAEDRYRRLMDMSLRGRGFVDADVGRSLLRIGLALCEAFLMSNDEGFEVRQFEIWRDLSISAGRDYTESPPKRLEGRSDVLRLLPLKLQQSGLTNLVLPCMIVDPRRITVEQRNDVRALISFCSEVSTQARQGLELLAAVEWSWMNCVGLLGPVRSDSVAPDVLMLLHALPAADVSWIAEVIADWRQLKASERVVQKVFVQLSDVGLIDRWSPSKIVKIDRARQRESVLWKLSAFNDDLRPIQRLLPRAKSATSYGELAVEVPSALSVQKLTSFDPVPLMSPIDMYAKFERECSEIFEKYPDWFVDRKRHQRSASFAEPRRRSVS